MTIITYLKKVPFYKMLFGSLLGLFGLFIFITANIIFGSIFLALGTNLILTEGAEINLENKTCRSVKSILGLKFGKWRPCPNFEYVSVFRTKETQRVNVVTASTAFTSEVILLNLFYGNKNMTFYKTDDITDAFKVAEHFKLALDIDILDATGNEKRWL